MTLRIKITHEQPDSEFAIFVGALRDDMTVEEGNFVEPGQTGEFHLWDGKKLILTEVPNGAHRAAQEAQAALNAAIAEAERQAAAEEAERLAAERAASGPLTTESAAILGTDIPSAPGGAPAAEVAGEHPVAE